MRRALAILVLALLLGATAVLAEGDDAGEIELAFANGEHRDLDSNLAPVRQGAMTIHVSSPQHLLTVHSNHLRFARAGDAVDASFEVDFEGEGDLVAVLEAGTIKNRLKDHVRAPRQTVRVDGRIRLQKIEGGYAVTFLEGPPNVELKIESELAGNLVSLCQVLSRIPLVPVRCDGLREALSVVTVPLPGADEPVYLDAARLTETERAFFDRFSQ